MTRRSALVSSVVASIGATVGIAFWMPMTSIADQKSKNRPVDVGHDDRPAKELIEKFAKERPGVYVIQRGQDGSVLSALVVAKSAMPSERIFPDKDTAIDAAKLAAKWQALGEFALWINTKSTARTPPPTGKAGQKPDQDAVAFVEESLSLQANTKVSCLHPVHTVVQEADGVVIAILEWRPSKEDGALAPMEVTCFRSSRDVVGDGCC